MATSGFQLAYGNPTIVHMPEHTTANSFTAGDLVYLSSGLVVLAADDDTVFGVAARAASGTHDTVIPIYVITPEQTWIVEMETTSAEAHIGEDYAVNLTAGSQSVNTDDTGSVVVIDFFEPVGTATGKVLVKFSPDVLQGYKI
jgi:hypothetical protein